MLKVVVVPKPVKYFFHSRIHLLQTLRKDGVWHLTFLSFILLQNKFDTMPDYHGKKKQEERKFSFQAQGFIKIGKMAL